MFQDRSQQVQATQNGQTESGKEKKQTGSGLGLHSVGQIMALQRSIGNRATTQLIQRMQAQGHQQPSANAPIQRMSDKDFNQKFAELMGINAKNMRVMSQTVKLFKNWMKSRIKDETQLMVDEFIDQDDFTAETLQNYVTEFKEFHNKFGPMEKNNDIADVPVPQGMYFVASQSELEKGLYTDGASPCVVVAFQVHLGGDDDVLALGHFDGETDPNMLREMFYAVRAKVGDRAMSAHPKITISLAGGVNDSNGSKKNAPEVSLTGPELFKRLAAIADGIASRVRDTTVIKRQSADNNDISARIDSQKGLKRYDKSVMNHKDVDLLKKNPKAMHSLKNLLDNGQMLNDANGDPVKYGTQNYNELESAYNQASQVDANGNDAQNVEE